MRTLREEMTDMASLGVFLVGLWTILWAVGSFLYSIFDCLLWEI